MNETDKLAVPLRVDKTGFGATRILDANDDMVAMYATEAAAAAIVAACNAHYAAIDQAIKAEGAGNE